MNVRNVENFQNQNISDKLHSDVDSSANSLKDIKSFSFLLELPKEEDIKALSEEQKQEEPDKQTDTDTKKTAQPHVLNQTEANLLKNIQDSAIKDQVPFKFKDIDDIRLHVFSQDPFEQKNKHKIDLDSLTDKDISFLKQCAKNPEMVLYTINQQTSQTNFSIQDGSESVSYKSYNFSKGLSNIIEYAYTTQRPVRLDFEGDSSVILKIDGNGKLSAEFMSSNLAMEHILKSSLPNLRNKLDTEGIPYKEIIYKENNGRQNKKDHNGG